MPIFAQNEAHAETIGGQGFSDVRVTETSESESVRLIKMAGRHGTEANYETIPDILGEVCGVVFRHLYEKTIYLAGDTIWNDAVAGVLSTHAPDITILNAGLAMVKGIDGGISMGTEGVLGSRGRTRNPSDRLAHGRDQPLRPNPSRTALFRGRPRFRTGSADSGR